MRFFYLVKVTQLVISATVLISILSTLEICSPFLSNKVVVQKILNNETCKQLQLQAGQIGIMSFEGIGAIMDSDNPHFGSLSSSRLGRFLSDVLRSWDELWGYDTRDFEASNGAYSNDQLAKKYDYARNRPPAGNYREQIPPKTPINKQVDNERPNNHDFDEQSSSSLPDSTSGRKVLNSGGTIGFRQCAKIRFEDYFGSNIVIDENGITRSGSADTIAFVLQSFCMPILLVFLYLIITFFHILSQEPLPYGYFALTLVFANGIAWIFVLIRMLSLDYNWNMLWQYSKIRPELMGSIVVTEVLTLVMLCTILIEILFNDVLLQNMYVTRYDSLSRLDMSNTSTTANGRVYHGMEPAESEDIFQQSYNSPSGLETAYCQAPPRNPMLFPPPKIC